MKVNAELLSEWHRAADLTHTRGTALLIVSTTDNPHDDTQVSRMPKVERTLTRHIETQAMIASDELLQIES